MIKIQHPNIALLVSDKVLTARLLDKLNSLGLPKTSIHLFGDNSYTLRYGNEHIVCKCISINDILDCNCNVVINTYNRVFLDKYASEILANNIKIIDDTGYFMNERDVCNSSSNLSQNWRVLSCTNGFVYALSTLLQCINQVNMIKTVIFSGHRSYTDNDKAQHLLDETKKIFFTPSIDHKSSDQIAFNHFILDDNGEAEAIRSIVNRKIKLYSHNVEIPSLNVDSAILNIFFDRITSTTENEIMNAITHNSDKFIVSRSHSMSDSSYDDHIRLHNIKLNENFLSLVISFDPIQQKISNMLRALETDDISNLVHTKQS